MTTPSLPDDLIGAFVSAAVADEVRRSVGTLSSLAEEQLSSIGAELTRLRAIVAEQAATITSLRQQLDEAQQANQFMPTEQLVAGLASAVTNGTAGMTGYVMSQAQLSLRASLITAGGGALVTGEPTLADPHLLSTINVTLRAVPPPPGQAAADASGPLRSAAETAQAALEPLLSRPATARPAGLAMAALAGILQDPRTAQPWAQLATGLPDLAEAVPDVADPARRLAETAAAVAQAAGAPPAGVVTAATAALAGFAEAVTAAGT